MNDGGSVIAAKNCYRCSKKKALTEFHKDRSKPDGRRADCADCACEWQAKYQQDFKAANGHWPHEAYSYAHTCETCGTGWESGERNVRFCSGTCANRARTYRLTCRTCRTDWDSLSPLAYWCSRECRRFGERTVLAQVAIWERPEGWIHPRYAVIVLKPLRRRWYAGQCACCREWFIHDQPQTSTCSPQCARKLGRAKRRATKKAAFVAPVSPRKIYERDRWRCQLCGEPVKRNAVVPHPLAPVPDHIVPLAAGGTHEPANVQCAHFLCNCRKGAGGSGEQLLLIG